MLFGTIVVLLALTTSTESFVLLSKNHSQARHSYQSRVRLPPTRQFPLSPGDKPARLHLAKDPNNDSKHEDWVFLAVALPAVLLLSLWPLIALFRDTSNPTAGFDVDMFMAIKGILESNNSSDSMDLMMRDGIVELPPLSPAEQLVGAIFGPP